MPKQSSSQTLPSLAKISDARDSSLAILYTAIGKIFVAKELLFSLDIVWTLEESIFKLSALLWTNFSMLFSMEVSKLLELSVVNLFISLLLVIFEEFSEVTLFFLATIKNVSTISSLLLSLSLKTALYGFKIDLVLVTTCK